MFSEAVDAAIISGTFAMGGIILHYEYQNIRENVLEYFLKKIEFN